MTSCGYQYDKRHNKNKKGLLFTDRSMFRNAVIIPVNVRYIFPALAQLIACKLLSKSNESRFCSVLERAVWSSRLSFQIPDRSCNPCHCESMVAFWIHSWESPNRLPRKYCQDKDSMKIWGNRYEQFCLFQNAPSYAGQSIFQGIRWRHDETLPDLTCCIPAWL